MPSEILSLVCLSIVRRFQPAWLAVTVADAARELNINPERVSRLSTKAQALFVRVLNPLLRRGRPPRTRQDDTQAQRLLVTQTLLEIASTLLAHISWRKPAIRSLVVGAYLRLQQDPLHITQKTFCDALALPPRTLRHWLAHPEPKASSSPQTPTPTPAASRKRPPRRHRFGFDVVLPNTQLAADTTDLSAFDCSLKLIAAQDVGGRHQNLLESIIVDDHESADLVVQALTDAIDGRDGFQVIVDQGTPYMAQATQDAIDALGAEHAPQVEGTPTDKATIERAFKTAKSIAAPLLALSDRLAHKSPALRNTRLAIALTTLLITALLKAYQQGARAQRRANEARAGICRDDLLEAAQQHRERARAEDRSRRLLLRFVHDNYDLRKPTNAFIQSLRIYPLQVLRRAESAFRTQVHRDDIRNRAAYFSAIVRSKHEAFKADTARRQHAQETLAHIQAIHDQHLGRMNAWSNDPASWLTDALQALAAQWLPASHQLLFNGDGIGKAWLVQAIDLLHQRHGHLATRDLVDGVFHRFATTARDRLGEDGICAIRTLLDQHLPPPQDKSPNPSCTQNFAAAILSRAGPSRCSAPEGALSILPATPGGS